MSIWQRILGSREERRQEERRQAAELCAGGSPNRRRHTHTPRPPKRYGVNKRRG